MDAVNSPADRHHLNGPDEGRDWSPLVEVADVASLLAALAWRTGDLGLVPHGLWLDPDRALEPDGGWDTDQVKQARSLAERGLDMLAERAESEDVESVPAPKPELLPQLVDWLTGAKLDDDYRTMLTEELAVEGDLRIPDPIEGFPALDSQAGPDVGVAVVGAGMSGILAAHRLNQAGVDFVVFDKNADVGGTWFENTYPGCRVDVFNHVYSYAAEQKPDWPEYHSPQQVLLDYFADCAQRWGIVDRIRFGAEVLSLAWDDRRLCWRIRLRDPSGTREVTAAAVISAVGQLNRPLLPRIDGAEQFAGEWFHSSAWRHDLDWRNKRVAVIGTGASAMQFIPHLAEAAGHVTVFQRTPPWLIPRPEYHQRLPEGLLELFRLVPGYANWFRLRLFWRTHEGTVAALHRDPNWKGPLERSVSEHNELARQLLTAYLEMQFADRPDLLAKVVPDYPVGAKRVVLDNGIWAQTLKRPNVELITEPIVRICDEGVIVACGAGAGETGTATRLGSGGVSDDSAVAPDGAGGGPGDASGVGERLVPVDVIVYGTGFRASEFLMPMQVTGSAGVDLHETWAGDARAYVGSCVPGFPNLFMLYGPNTNIVVNGSIIYFSECSVNYALECLRMLAGEGAAAMDCRADAHERYAAKVDARNAEMAWGLSKVRSWYKSPSGRVAQNWPFPLIDFWRQTRTPNPSDFAFLHHPDR